MRTTFCQTKALEHFLCQHIDKPSCITCSVIYPDIDGLGREIRQILRKPQVYARAQLSSGPTFDVHDRGGRALHSYRRLFDHEMTRNGSFSISLPRWPREPDSFNTDVKTKGRKSDYRLVQSSPSNSLWNRASTF